MITLIPTAIVIMLDVNNNDKNNFNSNNRNDSNNNNNGNKKNFRTYIIMTRIDRLQ